MPTPAVAKTNHPILHKAQMLRSMLRVWEWINIVHFIKSIIQKKTCPQWNHNMNALVAHIIDIMLSVEQTELAEEKEESIAAEETLSVGHVVNTFSCVHAVEKNIFEEKILSEASTQQKNILYNL